MSPCLVCGHEEFIGVQVCATCGTELGHAASAPTSESVRNKVRLFRGLVLLSNVAYLIVFLYVIVESDLMDRHVVEPDAREAIAWSGYGALFPLPQIWNWSALLLYLVAAAGLLRFSWPARLVYTSLLLIDLFILDPLQGVDIGTPISRLLISITLMADGAILVMAWTSPLNRRFVNL